MAKIMLISLIMGACVLLAQQQITALFPAILHSKWLLLFELGGMGVFALAIFLAEATIFKVIDFQQLIRAGRRKYGQSKQATK
jgi:hypothetical protein